MISVFKDFLKSGGETYESPFFEMLVKGEGSCNPQKPHGFKTHAINKTQLFTHSGKHDSHGSMMRNVLRVFTARSRRKNS